MSYYCKAEPSNWTGRKSGQQLYLHEKVGFIDLDHEKLDSSKNNVTLLGYACDQGVKRNQGRIGSFDGPEAIRKQLGKMPNHLDSEVWFSDVGTVQCLHADMEGAQDRLAQNVVTLLECGAFPILVGGGHDMAYPHYSGIKKFLGKDTSIGIINFDAHFDLRNNSGGNNSGTPFYQIAKDCETDGSTFKYMCLGIRKDANDKVLFDTANELGVHYISNKELSRSNAECVVRKVLDFVREVDHIYTTIDLDGFSSAFAPGVSAASPMGFAPPIVLEALKVIIDSKKLISLDIAEMNPKYDRDGQTAKLAASLIHFVIHNGANSLLAI
jgi:formiminoglutamase